jgi:hypothetical protein
MKPGIGTGAQEGNRTPDLRITSEYLQLARDVLKNSIPSQNYATIANGDNEYRYDTTD